MIKASLKLTAVAAILAGASVGANAETTDLGTVALGTPTTFSGVVQGSVTSINDIFTFNLEQGNTASVYLRHVTRWSRADGSCCSTQKQPQDLVNPATRGKPVFSHG